jgi:hypothetical protein
MSLFSPPKPPEPAAVPKPYDEAEGRAMAKVRELARRRRGALSTIYTSPQGVAGPAPVATKTLMGA